MPGISSCGECVRRVVRYDINFRHRNANLRRQPVHDLVDAGKLLACDWLCAISGQGNFVREEVGDEVGHDGEAESQDHSILTAKRAAEEHQKQRQQGKKKSGLKGISHFGGSSVSTYRCYAGWGDAWQGRDVKKLRLPARKSNRRIMMN